MTRLYAIGSNDFGNCKASPSTICMQAGAPGELECPSVQVQRPEKQELRQDLPLLKKGEFDLLLPSVLLGIGQYLPTLWLWVFSSQLLTQGLVSSGSPHGSSRSVTQFQKIQCPLLVLEVVHRGTSKNPHM